MSVDDVSEELYGLPPDQFIEVRNARAKELTASGDRESAAVVRKLPKPSLSAWLANMLVRKHPREIGELLDLGQELRQDQRTGAGGEIRRLGALRQEMVKRLVMLASTEAETAGQTFGPGQQGQLEGTLEAAVADQSASEELRAGKLAEALSHVGFGEVTTLQRGAGARSKRDRGDPEKRSGAPKITGARGRIIPDQRELDDAERALTKARAAMESSSAELDYARRRHEVAAARQRDAAKEFRDAERELAQASAALEVARQKRQRDERNVKDAEREQRRLATGSRR
jgi:hypothetical protein